MIGLPSSLLASIDRRVMDILAELSAFDGKRTDVLEALAARLMPDERIIDKLCALAGHDDLNIQSAVTWLLKRFQETGTSLSPDQVGGLLDLLDRVVSWDARLHLLQMLPRFDIPEARTADLMAILSGNDWLESNNKLVRAWSYNGLAALAERNPALRIQAAALLQAGERDEAASVRARVRNIVRENPWVRMAQP